MLVGTRVLQGIAGAMMVPVGRSAALRYPAKSDLVRAIALSPARRWPYLSSRRHRRRRSRRSESWRWTLLEFNIPIGTEGF